ncbi:MAG TPA: S9 family peptidase [Anaerolineae bacterium]|nr:S9 family peptidase [Anaerolineae bacterium]HIP73530.1 S9 family peptidase [Anaerolineae bacterium]
MMDKKVAPYGSWQSPITTDLIASGSIRLGEVQLAGNDIYWVEGRPAEDGRNVLVKWSPMSGIEDITPAGYNVRTRVHEYGGGAYAVHDDAVWFSNFADQRLYAQMPHSEPEPLTVNENLRFADGLVDIQRERLICVREAHLNPGEEPVNTLISLNLNGRDEAGDTLAAGNDFYSSPALSPDGRQLAFLTWNHPNMPWDGVELWVGDLNEAGTALDNLTLVAGGPAESIFQPQWSPDGTLFFVSDRSDWWNLHRWHNGMAEALYPLEAEFGMPQWVFGMSTYGFADANTIVCSYTQDGRWHLARLDVTTRILTDIDTPYTSIFSLRVGDDFAVFIGGSAVRPSAIVRLDLTTGDAQELRQSTSLTVDEAYLSIPQPIEFPTENFLSAYALYYPPQNGDFTAPEGEKPPLLVNCHGGPTSQARTALSLGIQYWTSRGFAYVDVNYGGSTGYGRPFRQRLNGQWGVVDVQDSLNAARYFVERGLADKDKLAVRGGSAGGYTTLAAVTFYNVFDAGASYFGISDLEAMTRETHKFESRYLDNLIGPYPEAQQLYHDRSPIHFAHDIHCPLILFQGLEDRVVPPNQAEMMYDVLRQKGVPVAYVPFAGEQHGFRQAKNIKAALEDELYFYGRVFHFTPADTLQPIPIENL